MGGTSEKVSKLFMDFAGGWKVPTQYKKVLGGDFLMVFSAACGDFLRFLLYFSYIFQKLLKFCWKLSKTIWGGEVFFSMKSSPHVSYLSESLSLNTMIGGALHCMYFMHCKMHVKCMHYALHENFGILCIYIIVHFMHFVKIFV